MTPWEPVRVLQVYSAEKNAEFAAMTPADRLAWLDEIRLLSARATAVSDAGCSIEPVAAVRKAGEAREDTEMGAYWRSRPPEERVAEAERLRRLGVSLAAGAAWKPAIERTGRVVRRGA